MSHHADLVCHVIAAEFLLGCGDFNFFCCRGAHILFLAAASICSIFFFFFAEQTRFCFFCTRDPILFLAAAPITGHHLDANGNVRWLTLMKEFPRKREHLQLDLLGMVRKWSILFYSDFKNLGTYKQMIWRFTHAPFEGPSIWFYASCHEQRDFAIIVISIITTLVRVATCLLSMPFFSKPITLWPLVAPCSFNKDH